MKILGVLILFAVLSSCSMIDTAAVKTTGRVIYSGSDELLTEANFQNFLISAPANLKLIEGLWYSDQDNKELLTLLIKGYGAFGFAGAETLALEDILLEKPNSNRVEQALLNYQKSINYGLQYLKLKGISKTEFFNKSFPEDLKNIFNSKLSQQDYIAIFYFAQALGGSINLQRTNVSKMSYMNHVQKMFEWVCDKDPSLERGACQLFDGIFLASLPSIMGGSQVKAREVFVKTIKDQPFNLLAQLSYIQYHLVPMMEEDEFDQAMKSLKSKLDDWYGLQLGNPSEKTKIFENNKMFNLYNSVAKERYNILIKLKDEIL